MYCAHSCIHFTIDVLVDGDVRFTWPEWWMHNSLITVLFYAKNSCLDWANVDFLSFTLHPVPLIAWVVNCHLWWGSSPRGWTSREYQTNVDCICTWLWTGWGPLPLLLCIVRTESEVNAAMRLYSAHIPCKSTS
jgi:hypothetical protein